MGRTLPTAGVMLMRERQWFTPFMRALSTRDRLALDELFVYASLHTAELQYTAFELPLEAVMLAMLLENHKEVMRIRKALEPEDAP
jgi:hypothetical protein